MTISREIYVDIEIELACEKCGSSLEWNDHQKRQIIYVTPCETCIEEAKKEEIE